MTQVAHIKKCGFVAIIGPPNAGKSTLSNALVGQKVAIVTQKSQTTRMRLRAVVMAGDAQLILVDTPGIFETHRRFDRAMLNEVWRGVEDADEVLLVLDVGKLNLPETELVLSQLKNLKKPLSLALNKIDLMARKELLHLVKKLSEHIVFQDIFLISALHGDGIETLKKTIAARLPAGTWLYPEDQVADVPSLLLAAEITREKLFLRLHQELPYAMTVESDKWENKKDGSVRIEQTIYVRRETQKAIVLGNGGKSIKAIGADARRELEEIFGHRVHLFIFVKVRKNWQEDPARYRALGLDYKA